MDINEFNLILGIVASLCTIGVAVAVTIRYIRDPFSFGEITKERLIAITLAVMTGIVVVAVIISHVGAAAISGTVSTSTPGTSLASPTTTSDTSITADTTTTAGPTGTQGAFPTPFINSYDNLSPYGNQTMTPLWRFDCGGCNESIRVQVSKVVTDTGNENMIWTLTLNNHTAENLSDIRFTNILLTDPKGTAFNATGAGISDDSNWFAIPAEQSIQTQATFPFLPRHGATYTLTSKLVAGCLLLDYCYTSNYQQTITFP